MRKLLFTLLVSTGFMCYAQDTIRFTWTANEGEQKHFTLNVPLGRTYTVDWGNDSIEIKTGVGGDHEGVFSPPYTAGIYTVTVTGSMTTYLDFFVNFNVVGTLTGALNLYNCTALRRLYCHPNNLTSLNVSGCIALELLECSNNQLIDLNLISCISLRELNCSNNNLTSLDANDCVLLRYLDCSSNQLTNLNVSSLVLQELRCYMNNLTNLDVSSCTALEDLYISYNQLSSLFVNNNLKGLLCDSNRFLLSDLYNISNGLEWRYLGTQTLLPRVITAGDTLDFSSQANFGNPDTVTVFRIEKDSMLADTITDYSIENGIITFYTAGNYTVTMTNAAIVSTNMEPAEVIVEITVKPKTNIERITNYELQITSYEIYDVMGKLLKTITASLPINEISAYAGMTQGRNDVAVAPSPSERAGGEVLPAGIYILKIVTDKGIITKKLLITK